MQECSDPFPVFRSQGTGVGRVTAIPQRQSMGSFPFIHPSITGMAAEAQIRTRDLSKLPPSHSEGTEQTLNTPDVKCDKICLWTIQQKVHLPPQLVSSSGQAATLSRI